MLPGVAARRHDCRGGFSPRRSGGFSVRGSSTTCSCNCPAHGSPLAPSAGNCHNGLAQPCRYSSQQASTVRFQLHPEVLMPRTSERQLVVALNYDARLINEVYGNWLGHGGYFVSNNLFNRLVVLDIFGEGGVSPDLAERWDILDNGARYRFHLRRDVVWHDGAPFTARDVAVTYGTALERGMRQRPGWTISARSRSWTITRSSCGCTPRTAASWPGSACSCTPASCLPTFSKGRTGSRIPPTSHRSGPGRTSLNPGSAAPGSRRSPTRATFEAGRVADRLTFTVVADGAEAFEQLKAGEVDFCTRYAACQDLDDLAMSPGVGVFVDPGNALAHIGFNVRRAPWSDQRVREAIARAVDRTALRDTVCSRALAVDQPYLPQVTWVSDPSIRLPARDLAQAETLLSAAGPSAVRTASASVRRWSRGWSGTTGRGLPPDRGAATAARDRVGSGGTLADSVGRPGGGCCRLRSAGGQRRHWAGPVVLAAGAGQQRSAQLPRVRQPDGGRAVGAGPGGRGPYGARASLPGGVADSRA